MKDKGPYKLIGLWQVWERLDAAPAPAGRRPEFLLEKLCGTFEAFPDDQTRNKAERACDTELGRDANVEERLQMASIVVGNLGWSAIQDHRAFDASGGYRHVHGSPSLGALHVYGPRPASLRAAGGKIWAPYAPKLGPSFETIMGRLREMAIEQGLEPGPIEPNVPDLAPVRLKRRSRSVNVGR